MNTPLFSIIIPVYNTEATLRRCLESCASQSFPDIEIIVINNGSKGDTKAIMADYPDVKYLQLLDNIGLFAARRYGVERASGDYIIHCDSDDVLNRDFCRRAAEKIKSGADLIISKVRSVYLKHQEDSVWANINLKDYQGEELFNALLARKYLSKSMWGKVFRKDIALKVYSILEFNDFLIMGEDCLFFVCYSYYAKVIRAVTKVCYYYYINDNSYNRSVYDPMKADRDLCDFGTTIRLFKKFADRHHIRQESFRGIFEDLSTAYLFRLRDIDGSPDEIKKLLPRIIETFDMQGIAASLYDAQLLLRGNTRFLLGRILEQLCPQGTWRYAIVRKFAIFLYKVIGK